MKYGQNCGNCRYFYHNNECRRRAPAEHYKEGHWLRVNYDDWEEVTDDIFEDVFREWCEGGNLGLLAWWCRKCGEKPQWPVEKSFRERGLWTDAMEALKDCEYDSKVRWADGHTREQAIKELQGG